MAIKTSPISRDHIPDLLLRGIDKILFDEWPIDFGEFRPFYNFGQADKAVMNHVLNSGFGLWEKKAEGAPPAFDTMQEAYRVNMTVVTWELGYIVTRESIQDNLYQRAFDMGRDLSQAGLYTMELDAMAPINNMTTTTVYTLDGTNYPLISTAHGRVDGNTWANRPTTPMDLSLESVEFAVSHWITNMVDHRGRKRTGLSPMKLWYGTSDWSIGQRITSRNGRPFGNNNEPNVLMNQYNLTPHCLKHITDDGRWGMTADTRYTGFQWWDRLKREFRKETEPITGNLVVIGSVRYASGAWHPHGFWASP